ncbi:MAG: ribosomal RNA small subunit methyltransferase A [Clostridia bacterium]|nr:ribosomal RNA small subunit methyltransferase A [Clostridia bacterium]
MRGEAAWIRRALAAHGLRPKKWRGQHFLVDRGACRRIVAALEVGPRDLACEVGPGLGALTALLAERAGRVVAVEVERGFEPILRERLAGRANVELRFEDARRTPWGEVVPAGTRAKLVGNLPYSLTGPLLGAVLAAGDRFERIVVMVQREVAERMTAAPGGRAYGFFSVFVQAHARVERLFGVPPQAFWPKPKVASAVVRLWPAPWPGGPEARTRLIQVARMAFSSRRKTLLNALAQASGRSRADLAPTLARAGIAPERRAETLSLPEFAALAGALLAEPPRGG